LTVGKAPIYVVPIGAHKAIGVDVGAICWGSCGNGFIGGVDLDSDSGIPCDMPVAECPHHDRDAAEPCGSIEERGEERPVYLRRLRAASPERGGGR
jgi:hypothetical protein